jgi:hypothetical protein
MHATIHTFVRCDNNPLFCTISGKQNKNFSRTNHATTLSPPILKHATTFFWTSQVEKNEQWPLKFWWSIQRDGSEDFDPTRDATRVHTRTINLLTWAGEDPLIKTSEMGVRRGCCVTDSPPLSTRIINTINIQPHAQVITCKQLQRKERLLHSALNPRGNDDGFPLSRCVAVEPGFRRLPCSHYETAVHCTAPIFYQDKLFLRPN